MLDPSRFSVKLATTDDEVRAAQHLRYKVFVEELGGDGPMVDHEDRLEVDRFDPYFDHLLLTVETDNKAAPSEVIGAYRVMTADAARAAGQFYSEDEYDLTPLLNSGRKLLELGRSCIDPAFRGGMALGALWSGLARYVEDREIEVLFGVASFHGTDVKALAPSLSLLHDRHLAPAELRVRAKDEVFQRMNLLEAAEYDAVQAMRRVPALIKSYLRLGGYVGDGAFVDHAFNTTDVFLTLDLSQMNEKRLNMLRGIRS